MSAPFRMTELGPASTRACRRACRPSCRLMLLNDLLAYFLWQERDEAKALLRDIRSQSTAQGYGQQTPSK